MDQNIFELAKKVAALSAGERHASLRLIREHGYKPGERTSAVIDLAKALISVWDGKASTLDQASAWREVWKYLSDAEMVREYGGRSPVQQVLDILGDYRRMSAGATPLNVQTAFPGTRLVQIMDGELPTEAEQVSREFDKDIVEIKTSCAAVMAQAPKAFTHCESSALIDKLASAVFNLALTVQKSHREVVAFMKQVCVIDPGCATQEQAETIARKYRQAHPEIAALWPTPSSEYSPYNAKPCHPSHELYKTGDADAPEQIKDRNGEVVLDQCRHCGRAGAELLDGEPCAKAPANENYPPELYGEHMSSALKTLATVVEPARLDVVRRLLVLQDTCYGLANNAGWWTDLEKGEDVRSWPKKHLDNWVSAKLMLIVTEVAEAMEGHRKGLMDDKIPHRGMLEVELADAVIRIMDLAGGLNMDVAGAIVEKLAYNLSREDHRIENRKAAGGKSV